MMLFTVSLKEGQVWNAYLLLFIYHDTGCELLNCYKDTDLAHQLPVDGHLQIPADGWIHPKRPEKILERRT